jgi:hypothetical protein
MDLTVVHDLGKIRRANQTLRAALKFCGGRSVPATVWVSRERAMVNVCNRIGAGKVNWTLVGRFEFSDLRKDKSK